MTDLGKPLRRYRIIPLKEPIPDTGRPGGGRPHRSSQRRSRRRGCQSRGEIEIIGMRAEEYLRAVAQLRARRVRSPCIPQPSTTIEHTDPRLIDLVGWRVWRVVHGYLQSVTAGTIWLPGEVMIGVVSDHDNRGVHAFKTRTVIGTLQTRMLRSASASIS
jgi:hypothetical protein